MPTTAKTIPAKLAEVMAALGRIEKKGFNKHQNYRFVRESDVVEALVPLLAERHLFLSSSITKQEMQPLYQTQSGMTMWLSEIWIDFTWHDGESGSSMGPFTSVGFGADTGDKSVYKAITGSEKYFLMKTFLISTGDDPESDEKVDKSAAAAGAGRAPRVTNRTAQPRRGGRPDAITDVQKSEMRDLFRQLGIKEATAIADVIGKVSGASVQPEKLADWIDALTAQQAGSIILGLTQMVGEAEDLPSEDVPEGDDDGFQL